MMRSFFLPLIFVFIAYSGFAQAVFHEDFQGEADAATSGAFSGTITWSRTYGGSGVFEVDGGASGAIGQGFYARNLDTEGVWQTQWIATSGTLTVNFSELYAAAGVGAGDYLRIYYSVDNNATENLLHSVTTAGTTSYTSGAIAVTTNIRITVRVLNADNFGGDEIAFDNVYLLLSGVTTLYSRLDGAWGTVGTWSSTALSGASCGCVPFSSTINIMIGDNDEVDFSPTYDGNNGAYIGDLTVRGTGTLRWAADDYFLAITGGDVSVETNGAITENGFASDFYLFSEVDFTVTNNGSIGVTNFIIGDADDVTFSGTGTMTVSEDFTMDDPSTFTYSGSGTGSVVITDDFVISEASTVTFNNSNTNTFTVTDDFNVDEDATINFNNSATVTVSNDVNFNDFTTVNFNNTGAVSLVDNVTVNQDVTFNMGNTGTSTIGGDLIVQLDDPLTINGSNNLIVSGELQLNDNLVKNGSGTVAITGRIYFPDVDSQLLDINAGTISTSQINFDTDNATISNAGTLTVTGNLGANDTFDDTNTITNEAGGTLTFVNLDGSHSSATGNGGDIILNNSGTINMSGNFADISTTCDLNNLATGVWNWSLVANSGFDTDVNGTATTGALDVSQTGNTFNYTGGTGTQTLLQKTYSNVGMSGTDPGGTNVVKRFPSTTPSPIINGNLIVSEEAQFDINTNNVSFTLGGNFTFSGTNPDPFDDGNGTSTETVTLNGTGDQTLTLPAAGETFQRLNVAKTIGTNAILVNNLTIRNFSTVTTTAELFLTSGNIVTSSSSQLILQDDVIYSGGGSMSFVDGPMQKIGNDAFIFPVGDQGTYGRIAITAPGSSQTFTAEYFNDPYSDLTVDNTLHHVSGYEYWSLTSTGGSSQVTLYWASSTNSDITDNSDLRIARYNGADWTDVGNVTPAGTTSGTIQTNSNQTTFGLFTFGSETGINPLPITLVSFTAEVNGNAVVLDWTTSMELNNDYFNVERSITGETFTSLATIASKGNGHTGHEYTFTDENPFLGRSYYRLKQTDFDGTVTYSPIRTVLYEGTSVAGMRVYPNPSAGKPVVLEIEGINSTHQIPVRVLNMFGQVVYEFQFHPAETGVTVIEMPLHQRLGNGTYVIRIGDSNRLTRKLVIN